ncbi:mannose-1-phosphate guanylyltransferase [Salinispora tropica]|uniref:Mannose-1-phosphate guanylyltransferase (GDP) n=1 Tax=Salinispora tropica (strain ATCC BAA-916 / DSM 44818 / JCM 13857 / NBRC 105044 / CNB-440) TaxID=369723 RepID=A4X3G7_SALTO|nr:sugar phosphate nucleotidyltransferase [Salinispora tropica]ABP53417.1 mannose-1-phosphate guanylyltransferase (GDP) [Salinispora tropica CNB-440]
MQVIYAVIPAGGSGTRLWPLSRAGHPKFLHQLTGSAASLLQATVERLGPLATPERTFVVTGTAHATAVARQLAGLPEQNILVEPSPRDSCAAIALAAAVIARQEPTAVMGSFAADHLIGDPSGWRETVRQAAQGAEQGLLMTVGITPAWAETGYGYLETGEPTGNGMLRPVVEFKEKPDTAVAEAYLRSGRHLWNASMFVWRVDVFLAELARQQPALHAGVLEIAAAWGTEGQDEVLGTVWPTLPKISVDYAVMEGAATAGRVATVPGDFGWNDVGDFHTLGEVLPTDPAGTMVLGGEAKPSVLLRDSTNLVVVPHSGRLVATVGVHDMIVVDTPDALLVCPRARAQDVKQLVDELKERGEVGLV